jgi:hypothetical protein
MHQLMQRRERELHLGLDPGHPQHANAGGGVLGEIQQRRHTDAGRAVQDQDATLPRAQTLDQPRDGGRLRLPPE